MLNLWSHINTFLWNRSLGCVILKQRICFNSFILIADCHQMNWPCFSHLLSVYMDMTPCTSFTHCIKAWPLPVPPDCWLQLFSFCSQGRMPRVSVFQVNGLFSLIVGFFSHGFFSEYKCWTSLPPKKNFFLISIREFSGWKFLIVGERGGGEWGWTVLGQTFQFYRS